MAKRGIATQYWNNNKRLRVNAAVHPGSALTRAVGHLQTDEYGATYAEVYSLVSGKLWAIFHRTPNQIKILYKRKVD